jgi:hypothetical protein
MDHSSHIMGVRLGSTKCCGEEHFPAESRNEPQALSIKVRKLSNFQKLRQKLFLGLPSLRTAFIECVHLVYLTADRGKFHLTWNTRLFIFQIHNFRLRIDNFRG